MKNSDFENQFTAATTHGEKVLASLLEARTAEFDAGNRRLILNLENGVTLLVPVDIIQGLQSPDEKALADVKLVLQGSQIHWPKLDVQMYVKSLIEGVFGTPAWMANLKAHYAAIGAKGGTSRSSAKSSASRQNGMKGGRPRKPIAA